MGETIFSITRDHTMKKAVATPTTMLRAYPPTISNMVTGAWVRKVS